MASFVFTAPGKPSTPRVVVPAGFNGGDLSGLLPPAYPGMGINAEPLYHPYVGAIGPQLGISANGQLIPFSGMVMKSDEPNYDIHHTVYTELVIMDERGNVLLGEFSQVRDAYLAYYKKCNEKGEEIHDINIIKWLFNHRYGLGLNEEKFPDNNTKLYQPYFEIDLEKDKHCNFVEVKGKRFRTWMYIVDSKKLENFIRNYMYDPTKGPAMFSSLRSVHAHSISHDDHKQYGINYLCREIIMKLSFVHRDIMAERKSKDLEKEHMERIQYEFMVRDRYERERAEHASANYELLTRMSMMEKELSRLSEIEAALKRISGTV